MLILTASLGSYIAAVALYQSQEKPALTTLAERLGAANLNRLKILGLVLLTAPLVLCWNALGTSRAISVWPDIVSVGGLVSLIWAPPPLNLSPDTAVNVSHLYSDSDGKGQIKPYLNCDII